MYIYWTLNQWNQWKKFWESWEGRRPPRPPQLAPLCDGSGWVHFTYLSHPSFKIGSILVVFEFSWLVLILSLISLSGSLNQWFHLCIIYSFMWCIQGPLLGPLLFKSSWLGDLKHFFQISSINSCFVERSLQFIGQSIVQFYNRNWCFFAIWKFKLQSRARTRAEQTPARAVALARHCSLILVDIRKDMRSPKTHSNIPKDRQLTALWCYW